uniref:Solute carrier family 41 member 1 n=2 Tax=Timema TaxID=61471 RepID=A0A7R9IR57_9NEOP|nr:unnamed protein product [Timema tahoe]
MARKRLHFGNRTAVSTVNMTKQFTTLNLPMSMDGDVMPCEGNVEVTFLDDPENGRLPDVVAETKINTSSNMEYSETYVSIAVQVFIPFLIAGFGMVGAGLVLDLVQSHQNNFDQPARNISCWLTKSCSPHSSI